MNKLHNLSDNNPLKDIDIDLFQQIITRMQALRIADTKLILAIESLGQDRPSISTFSSESMIAISIDNRVNLPVKS